MLSGRFGGTTGRPYIEAFLSIPSMGINGAVSFLIDTGADSTVLMQADATRLQLDYSQLTPRQREEWIDVDRIDDLTAQGRSVTYHQEI